MIDLVAKLVAMAQGRSSQWPVIRKTHLQIEPECQVCGEKGKNDAHHVIPFHLSPSRELDPTNLITLCRPHHLLVGHLMEWTSWNEFCLEDADHWRQKIIKRPRGTAK